MPFTWGGPISAGGPTNPIGIIVSIIDFIASLLGLGQNDTKVLETAINNTYENLVTTSIFTYNFLGSFGSAISDIWGKLKDLLDDLRWAVIVPIIEKIQQIIDDITTWLANVLDPIITFIQNLMQWYKQYIYPILHAVQQILSVVRTFLSILKLIGVKWAAKLDADIQLIQAWVTLVMQTVTATLNTVSTVLGLMVDPTGILRRDFFTGTLFSSLGAVKQASTFGNDRPSTPGELSLQTNSNALVQGDLPLATINPNGNLTYRPGMSDIDSSVRAGYGSLGVPVLGN